MPTAIPEIFPSSPHPTTRRNQTVINASLEGVANVFGDYMFRAIRRSHSSQDRIPSLKAAVTMEFPDFVLVDCVMMLEVCKREVEHLVKDLNTSNPEITLKGVRDEAIF
jgi:hypothetical protein